MQYSTVLIVLSPDIFRFALQSFKDSKNRFDFVFFFFSNHILGHFQKSEIVSEIYPVTKTLNIWDKTSAGHCTAEIKLNERTIVY